MSVKPSIPKGTRDFSPEQVAKRNYIFNTIRSVFEKYGYQPIETPTMENLSTLTGKYGDEGDKLLFKVLNSGNFLDGISQDKLTLDNYKQLTADISEKGLRYDLTVPFARYVVMHQNDITFPFKRYQIQPVFRADRPQRGRYREFYQCDADVVGSDSLLNEVELIQIYDEVFTKLGIDVIIKINNRKILQGIAEVLNIPKGEKEIEFITIIDKLDKIGQEKVMDDLKKIGLVMSSNNLDIIGNLTLTSTLKPSTSKFPLKNESRISTIEIALQNSSIGMKGVEEMRKIFTYLDEIKLDAMIEFAPNLARGLNYYTGAIIEVKANDVQIGSIGGGGRYDDLTGVFGLKGLSGVGISFGADRIYDVLEELKLFPETIATSAKVLFVNFTPSCEKYSLPIAQNFRNKEIYTEIYPYDFKEKSTNDIDFLKKGLPKALKYADSKNIPFVILVKESELKQERSEYKPDLKNMASGEQEKLTIEQIIERLKN